MQHIDPQPSPQALPAPSVSDPLPSWNDGPARTAILDFVKAVTTLGSADFVAPPQRIAAFGNSDGDFEMLEYVTAGPGRRLGMIVHHTDSDREWAYDRGSHVGKLARGLDEAGARGWILADMKRDWKVVHPPR